MKVASNTKETKEAKARLFDNPTGITGIEYTWYFSDDLGKTPVQDIILDNRSNYALQRDGINTAEQLAKMWNVLGSIRNLGAKSIMRIHSDFLNWYISEVQETPTWYRWLDSIKAVRA